MCHPLIHPLTCRDTMALGHILTDVTKQSFVSFLEYGLAIFLPAEH